jgi:hypothetical protein
MITEFWNLFVTFIKSISQYFFCIILVLKHELIITVLPPKDLISLHYNQIDLIKSFLTTSNKYYKIIVINNFIKSSFFTSLANVFEIRIINWSWKTCVRYIIPTLCGVLLLIERSKLNYCISGCLPRESNPRQIYALEAEAQPIHERSADIKRRVYVTFSDIQWH